MRRVGRLCSVFLSLAFVWSCSSSGTTVQNDVSFPGYDTEDLSGEVFVCEANTQCEDNNPCTDNLCNAYGLCEFVILTGNNCNDGNECTVGEKCDQRGYCISEESLACDDENSCTQDSCDPGTGCVFKKLSEARECDGSPCTIGDMCGDGICTSGPPMDCQDKSPDDCTESVCDASTGKCTVTVNRPSGHACKDGNPCTVSDTCDENGNCVAGDPFVCAASHPCMKARCNEFAKEGAGNPCISEWKTADTGCDDGDACTENDTCVPKEVGEGLDCKGAAVDCNDQNDCTTDSCDEESGCQFLKKNDNSPCDLGQAYCEAVGHCEDGVCKAELDPGCDDKIPCTEDVCVGDGECSHTPRHELCDDKIFCNGSEICDREKGCVTVPLANLDDGIECTEDYCDEETGQVLHKARDAACGDGDRCNGVEYCNPVDGCHKGTTPDCDDKIMCTRDRCDPIFGCVNEPDSVLCADGSPCTDEQCIAEAGGCVYTKLSGVLQGFRCCTADAQCADTQPCTEDVCLKDLAYCKRTNLADGVGCDDKLNCTEKDNCQGGVCSGIPQSCDDGRSCTKDECTELAGCTHTVQDNLCNDLDACNGVERCALDGPLATGGCITESVPDCDDKVACTLDTCDKAGGCKHEPKNESCDDKQFCTDEVCSLTLGCQYTARNERCDDKDACNGVETCVVKPDPAGNGCAPGTPPVCNDTFNCTEDSCDPLTGCKHILHHTLCNDFITCTADSCDAAVGCKYVLQHNLCSDGYPCTDDVCTLGVGCKNPLKADQCLIDFSCIQDGMSGDEACLICDVKKSQSSWTILNNVPCDDRDPRTTHDTCTAGQCLSLADDDMDGIPSEGYASPCKGGEVADCNDNCPAIPNTDQADEDADGIGDYCDGFGKDFVLYEPCVAPSPPFSGGDCEPGRNAWDLGLSSWRRVEEPIEVTLYNGMVDYSLLGIWRFGTKGPADCSIYKRASTLTGTEVYTAGPFGETNGAFSFNKTTYFDLKATLVPGPDNEAALAAWIKIAKCSTCVGWVVGRREADSSEEFGLLTEWDGTKVLGSFRGKSGAGGFDEDCGIRGKKALDDGAWHLLGVTWTKGTAELYVDGELQGTKSCLSALQKGAARTLFAGAVNNGGAVAQYLKAELDEISLFTRAVSAREFMAWYRSQSPYGSRLAAEALPDMDDLRVQEYGVGATPSRRAVTHEIIGPRVHSDSPCPAGADTGTYDMREDLCGVLAYWRLDGDGKDVRGIYDGVVEDAQAAYGRFGISGGSLYFDGLSDAETSCVEVTGSQLSNLRQANAFTLEAWVYPLGQDATPGCVVDIEENGGYGLCVDAQLKPYFSVYVGGYKYASAADSLIKGRWHHLAGVYNGSSVVLYVNGFPVATTAVGKPVTYNTNIPLHIGNNPSFSPSPDINSFIGYIDEVLIHSVAKAPEYIHRRGAGTVPFMRFMVNTEADPILEGTDLYPYRVYRLAWGRETTMLVPLVSDTWNLNQNTTCYGLLSPCNGYDGWWRFDERYAGLVEDLSVKKRHLNIHGSPGWVSGMEGPGSVAASLNGLDNWFDSTFSALSGGEMSVELITRPSACKGTSTLVAGLSADPAADPVWQLVMSGPINGGGCTPKVLGNGLDLISLESLSAGSYIPLLLSYKSGNISLIANYGTWTIGATKTTATAFEKLVVGAALDPDLGGQPFQFHQGVIDSVRVSRIRRAAYQQIHYPVSQFSSLKYGCGAWCTP